MQLVIKCQIKCHYLDALDIGFIHMEVISLILLYYGGLQLTCREAKMVVRHSHFLHHRIMHLALCGCGLDPCLDDVVL